MENNTLIFKVVILCALITYGLRVGGLLLSERLPNKGRFKAFMDALPGTLLLSLIAPGIAASGPWGMVAALSTAVITHRTGNVFLSMLVGGGVVAFSRHFF